MTRPAKPAGLRRRFGEHCRDEPAVGECEVPERAQAKRRARSMSRRTSEGSSDAADALERPSRFEKRSIDHIFLLSLVVLLNFQQMLFWRLSENRRSPQQGIFRNKPLTWGNAEKEENTMFQKTEKEALELLNLKEPYDAGMIERAYARCQETLNMFETEADQELLAARIKLHLTRATRIKPAFKDPDKIKGIMNYRLKLANQLAETDPESLAYIVGRWEEWTSEADIHRDIIGRLRARSEEAI